MLRMDLRKLLKLPRLKLSHVEATAICIHQFDGTNYSISCIKSVTTFAVADIMKAFVGVTSPQNFAFHHHHHHHRSTHKSDV